MFSFFGEIKNSSHIDNNKTAVELPNEPHYCDENCKKKYQLHEAAKNGELETFKNIVAELELATLYKLWEVDCQGSTVLHIISQLDEDCDVEMAELILRRKTDVPSDYIDKKDSNGNASIHYAATIIRLKLVALLIKHGANSMIPDAEGKLPLNLSSKCYGSAFDSRATCELLLLKGDYTEFKKLVGVTPLSESRSVQVIELLLLHGFVYKEVLDYDGWSPLHNAIVYADDNSEDDLKSLGRILELLDAEYVNSQIKSEDDSRTPLLVALYKPKVASLLISNVKVDLFKTDAKGNTILHEACIQTLSDETKATLDLLFQSKKLQNGDDKTKLLNIKNNDGKTALEIGIDSDSVPLSEYLLLKYPDPQSTIEEKIMMEIYEKVPEIMLPLITVTKSVSKDGDAYYAGLWPITGCHLEDSTTESEDDKPPLLECETDYLSCILESKDVKIQEQSNVLGHPIVEMFIFAKWDKVKWLFWVYFCFQIFLILLYVIFVTDAYLFECPYSPENIGENDKKATCRLNIADTAFGITVVACLLFNFIGRTLVVFHTLGCNFKKYFRPSFIIQSLFTIGAITTILFAILFGTLYWQYWLSSINMILAALLSLSFISQIPTLGIYADVFYNVLRRLVVLMLAFSPLLLSFSIAISLVLPNYKPFANPLLALLKVLVMMTGEINFDDVFHKPEYTSPLADFGLGIFALFTILVAIIMFNLLLGFTISDIKELQDTSETQLLITTLEQVIMLERLVFSAIVQKIVSRQCLERVLLTETITIKLEELPIRVRSKIRDLVKTKDTTREK